MLTKHQIQTYPKIELHCHLDGSIRPETLIEIAHQQEMMIEQDITIVRKHMQAPIDCHDLTDYLDCFDFVLPYLQTEQALVRAAFDVMEQAAEDGVAYIEIRFAPSLSMKKGLTCQETIQAVAKGIALAEAQYPIKGNILIIGMRQEERAAIASIFAEATALAEAKVVGLDLAGPEIDGYVPALAESYRLFVDGQSIQLTLHAGECGCVHNIYQAIESGAQRIGHGIVLKGDQQGQAFVREHEILIEGCPTSNVHTRAIDAYADYPLREWLQNHVHFCLNTDNRTVSNTTLTNEYWQMVQHCGLTKTEFETIMVYAVQHSFATEEDKDALLAQLALFSGEEAMK